MEQLQCATEIMILLSLCDYCFTNYIGFLFVSDCTGSVAEWSKALVLGTSLFGGVGSNPTAANNVFHFSECFVKSIFELTGHYGHRNSVLAQDYASKQNLTDHCLYSDSASPKSE